MVEKKYIVEFLGVMVILTTKLLTEAQPIVMGLVYFSVYWMTRGITSGFFSPFGPYAAFLLGRGSYHDMMYNIAAQVLGATAAVIVYRPIKAYMD